MDTLSNIAYQRDCAKYHHLKKYRPELSKPDEVSQLNIHNSRVVFELAREIHGEGLDLRAESERRDISQVELTEIVLKAKEPGVYYYPALYSAKENLYAELDIMVISEAGIKIIDVKSATKIKEPQHIDDVGLQWRIMQEHDVLKKAKIVICHLNPEYIHDDELDFDDIFSYENVTRNARENQPEVEHRLYDIREALSEEQRKFIPNVEVGRHCNTPYSCEFKEFCYKKLKRTSVTKIKSLSKSQIETLQSLGVHDINEIPATFKLTHEQATEISLASDGKKRVNRFQLSKFLKSVLKDGPIGYLDFETESSPIPQYKGCRPYQHLPVQYCFLHQGRPGSQFTRKEFIATPGLDPRMYFLERLIADVIKTEGPILVYYEKFEKKILEELSSQFPDYKREIDSIVERIVDLSEPFKNKHYYHPAFEGRYSLKVVVPVLCPNIRYDKLNIRNGSMAMLNYSKLPLVNESQRLKIVKDLREYCYTDVLSMVMILDALKKIVHNS